MNRAQLDSIKQEGKTLSIRARLLIGCGMITLIFVIGIGFTLYVVNNTKIMLNQVVKIDMPLYDMLLDLGGQVRQVQSSMRSYLLTGSTNYRVEIDATTNNIKKLQESLDKLIANTSNVEMEKSWSQVQPFLASLMALRMKFDAMQVNPNDASNSRLIIDVTTTTNGILDIIDGKIGLDGERSGGIFDKQYQLLHTNTEVLIAGMSNIQLTEYFIVIGGIIASLLIAFITAKNISKHINVFREFSSKIASRDLRQSLDLVGDDEIGKLGQDLNIMTLSLSDITKQINSACQNMVTTLEEVRQAVDVQSSGATEQASSINEITASLEEIEKSSAQTMEKAKMLGVAAEHTREKGQLGLDAVEQSIAGMKTVRDKVQMIAQTILDLSNQTQQVGDITAVVNGLAQQSKILALNASIEAAKAGEAGKGFAVVAAEVKNLAEQSEQSTAQVQKILEDIRHATEKAVMVTEEGTKGVDVGTGLVEQTGEIVRNLSEVIHETTVASQQIEAAVRQESVGIEQITSGMNEINQVTAAFVASAKQTTEAVKNLADIAKNIKEQVDTYKV